MLSMSIVATHRAGLGILIRAFGENMAAPLIYIPLPERSAMWPEKVVQVDVGLAVGVPLSLRIGDYVHVLSAVQ